MAKINVSDDNYPVGAYARIVGLDTAPMNLETKSFLLEISKDEVSRDEGLNDRFKRIREYKKLNFADVWNLELGLSTTVEAMIVEAYRCLDISHPEFSTKWDDEV